MGTITQELGIIRDDLGRRPPPVIIFNKSHSGSRLLCRLVEAGGFFMGARLNESHDALEILPLVRHLVERYYPDYRPLWDNHTEDDALVKLARNAFDGHLQGAPLDARWGWKLCETLYILPLLDFLFPKARYIHLIRDGRDVAFSDHTPPNTPFWQKIYFNTDRLDAWQGRGMRRKHYKRQSHIYNAQHWVNSVLIGRAFGSMAQDRYIEVKYEDLCLQFDPTARALLRQLDAPRQAEAVEEIRSEVQTDRISKFSKQSWWKQRQVMKIADATLASFGYT